MVVPSREPGSLWSATLAAAEHRGFPGIRGPNRRLLNGLSLPIRNTCRENMPAFTFTHLGYAIEASRTEVCLLIIEPVEEFISSHNCLMVDPAEKSGCSPSESRDERRPPQRQGRIILGFPGTGHSRGGTTVAIDGDPANNNPGMNPIPASEQPVLGTT